VRRSQSITCILVNNEYTLARVMGTTYYAGANEQRHAQRTHDRAVDLWNRVGKRERENDDPLKEVVIGDGGAYSR
jgi:hypothetical protein